MADMGDGSFAMLAPDANLDGQATADDFNLWLVDTKAGATGYRLTDFNLYGHVTASDFNIWLAATKSGRASQVPY